MPRRTRASTPHEADAASRFLRAAQQSRARDLKQLLALADLVGRIGELVHALQKERGASTIFLGSKGARFARQREQAVVVSAALEQEVRERLEHFDEQLQPPNAGTRFYLRGCLAFKALDALSQLRRRTQALDMPPQAAGAAYSSVISHLLAVGFESADMAADPATSRAIIALMNFAQGKEYAGQERALAGGGISRGTVSGEESVQLQYLVEAQSRAFAVFIEFAEASTVREFERLEEEGLSEEFRAARTALRIAVAQDRAITELSADHWYAVATRRIDAMRPIEQSLNRVLGELCERLLAQANAAEQTPVLPAAGAEPLRRAAPVAMVLMDSDPYPGSAGAGQVLSFDADLPGPIRPMLEVLEAQSRTIEDVSHQLEGARAALTERKLIERAKGLLMKGRRLSEADAYALMRETAMRQNRRLAEVAEAIIGMGETLAR